MIFLVVTYPKISKRQIVNILDKSIGAFEKDFIKA
jgi:hypothetical protein